MVNQYEGQLPESTTTPRKSKMPLLEKVGWGILGAAIALWGLTSLMLLYGGAPVQTGWNLLWAFVALIAFGLTLMSTGGRIERSLFGRQLPQNEPTPVPADPTWVEHWDQMMNQAVR